MGPVDENAIWRRSISLGILAQTPRPIVEQSTDRSIEQPERPYLVDTKTLGFSRRRLLEKLRKHLGEELFVELLEDLHERI